MAEKITVRVVAPRNIDSLNKFVLDLSVCQAVHEIQILWPHESPRPPDSYFKYPHTHSVVTFVETYGKNTWETLYGQVKISTDGVLLLDADVILPCNDLAFAQTVWRSSRDAQVGFFPRAIGWQESSGKSPQVKLLGWSHIGSSGAYSLMLPVGLFLRREYLQSMAELKVTASASTTVPVTREKLKSYVNTHPHCADLALPLWVSFLSSRGGEAKVRTFPPAAPVPPVWVDVPGLGLRAGVELSAYPAQQTPAPGGTTGSGVGGGGSSGGTGVSKENSGSKGLAGVKVKLSAAQQDACLTDMVALLQLSKDKLPEAHYKSTIASSHWVW